VGRGTESIAGSGFDLADHQHSGTFRDDVDLTASTTPVSCHHLVPLTSIPIDHQVLAVRSEISVVIQA
jgi:hypothetical protein